MIKSMKKTSKMILALCMTTALFTTPAYSASKTDATKKIETVNIETPRNAKININTADAESLAAVLSGIGLKKAKAIIEFRKTKGNFKKPSDLQLVKGIGPGLVKKNIELMRVK